jgi:5'-3' exonuclease
MGIPMFYSWLLQKYPKIKIPCKEDNDPNGIEVNFCICNDDPIFI